MNEKQFDDFWADNREPLMQLIQGLRDQISDEYRAYPDDEQPGMQLTISINADCDEWTWQTGDNSLTGACYHHPHWGVGAIYRDSLANEVAKALIDDLASAIEFENTND